MAIISNIALVFKADTTQARRAIKELTGDQKKLAQETLKAQEKQNEGLERQIITLKRAAIATAGFVIATKVLLDAHEKYEKATGRENEALKKLNANWEKAQIRLGQLVADGITPAAKAVDHFVQGWNSLLYAISSGDSMAAWLGAAKQIQMVEAALLRVRQAEMEIAVTGLAAAFKKRTGIDLGGAIGGGQAALLRSIGVGDEPKRRKRGRREEFEFEGTIAEGVVAPPAGVGSLIGMEQLPPPGFKDLTKKERLALLRYEPPEVAAETKEKSFADRKIEEFEAIVSPANQANMALQGVGSAATAAFAAMLSGTEGFGKAFKRAMGEMLASQASQLFGVGIQSGVMALFSWAIGDAVNATKFKTAAGLAFAGAFTLGAMARAMGAGRGTQGGAMPAAAGGTTSAGFIGDRGNASITIITGSDLDDNPRKAAQRISKQLLRARRAIEGGDDSVSYS